MHIFCINAYYFVYVFYFYVPVISTIVRILKIMFAAINGYNVHRNEIVACLTQCIIFVRLPKTYYLYGVLVKSLSDFKYIKRCTVQKQPKSIFMYENKTFKSDGPILHSHFCVKPVKFF